MFMRVFSTAVSSAFIALMLFASGLDTLGQSPYPGSDDFARYAMKLQEKAVLKIEPQVVMPTKFTPFFERGYPWKANIETEVFWVGQPGSGTSSAWDPEWKRHYGGLDNPRPSARRNYMPIAFTPRQNPFYCELPYNDVTAGTAKPEAPLVIPWFKEAYRKYGESVCKNRWVEIRSASGKTCYAQWADCGPGGTDEWQYVFGNQNPPPDARGGAGLGVSPAVRDYLGLSGTDVTSWRFVDYRAVPPGAWSNYGENNDFLMSGRRDSMRAASVTGTGNVAPAAR
jgi:hypothetical protein